MKKILTNFMALMTAMFISFTVPGQEAAIGRHDTQGRRTALRRPPLPLDLPGPHEREVLRLQPVCLLRRGSGEPRESGGG